MKFTLTKSDPIDAAIAFAEKARGIVRALDEKTATTQSAFDGASADAATAVLDAIEAGSDAPTSDRAMRLSTELDALRRARPAATKKVLDAVSGIYAAACQFEMAEAARLRAEATKIADATRPLLARLGELENVTFDRSILQHQRAGDWYSTRVMGGRFANEDDGPGAAPDPTNNSPFAIPRSVKARWQAELHDRRALELQGMAEAVSGGDVEQLLQQAIAIVRPAPEQVEAAA